MTDRILTASELTIDLAAIRRNYEVVLAELDPVPAAGMIKANGYGLGAVEVAQSLSQVGCTTFFVAHVDEAIAVRTAVPGGEIHVLNGAMPGTEADLLAHRCIPVLNSLAQLDRWRAVADGAPATLHFDTGMSRLGLPPDETDHLLDDQSVLDEVNIVHVMSHLASADVPGSQQSEQQLERFDRLRGRLATGTASLANSAGIFLGPRYHFDLARPGIALYGGNPTPGAANPMESVATLEAPILQVRRVEVGEVIGYGATHVMDRDGLIATIALGYADGFLRSASGRGRASINGQIVPLVGRVSMDLITLDVSDVPENDLYLGAPVELIGSHCPIDEVADRAGSIANEILTDLGQRYRVSYRH